MMIRLHDGTLSFVRSLSVALAATVMVLAFSGCAAWVTYPPIGGSTQIGAQRLEPVPSIMAEAIRYTNRNLARGEGTIVYNLPEGSTAALFDSITLRLRDARPMVGDEPAVHVTQVRVRAAKAEVDVIYPQAEGQYEFVTLYMQQRVLHQYEVRDTRRWRIQFEVPAAQHVPPPPREQDGARRGAVEADVMDDDDDDMEDGKPTNGAQNDG